MGQKTNNRILWHGNGLNAEGKAVAPVKAVAGGDGTDGLNEGELYICNSDSDPALFILTDAGNVVRIDGNGSDTYTREQINEKLNAKVDVAFFSRMFGLMDEEGGEIQVNDVETLASSIKAKLGFWTEQYLSAKGKNPDSGSEPGGSTTLAGLTDVSITGTPGDGQVLAFDATLNKWTPVDMEATAGIDEEELLQILTQKGYATQQWVTQQSYAKTSVRIKAGTGLTGGGTLAQDVTLSLATVGTAGTYTKVTVDAYGRVTGHSTLTQGDIPALAISKITGLQTALDAKMDAADKSDFMRYVDTVTADGDTLYSAIGIRSFSGCYPDSLPAGMRWYNYGEAISFPVPNGMRFDLYANHHSSSSLSTYNRNGLMFRTGFHNNTINGWRMILDSTNYNGYVTTLDNLTHAVASDYIQVGSARLRYDSANNALYVQKSDGSACGFYTTGFVSAKGANGDAGSAVAGVTELTKLEDVTISSPVNGQALVYRNGVWKNEAIETGLTSVSWNDVTGKPAPLANDQYYYGHGKLTTDFNDAVKGGAYYTASEAWPSNGPDTSYRFGALAVFHAGTDNMRVAQLWMSHDASSAGGVYVRMKYESSDGDWRAWRRLLDDACITDYTVTKTGGGASGTWGIGISGNAATATKLQTARTIYLTGDATGSASFNGSANATIAVTVSHAADADTLDGNHATAFMRYVDLVTQDSDTLYSKIGIRQFNQAYPDTLPMKYRWYNYGEAISFPTAGMRLDIYANHNSSEPSSNRNGLTFRTGFLNSYTYEWRMLLDDVNYNAYVMVLSNLTHAVASNYLQVGSGRIYWDSTNNALYVQKSDGTACGFYATGFVSAKGANSSSGSAVAGVTELAGLDDVVISNPVDGQSLVRRNGVWKNETVNYGITMDVDWDNVKNKPTWIPNTDGSGSGIDADLLDGTHKSGLFTAMSYSGSTLSITIGGTRRTATIEAGGGGASSVSVSSSSSRNISVTVDGHTDYVNDVYATYSTYADQLRTARTIWGQSFNGGGSVSGAMSGVTNINMSGTITLTGGCTIHNNTTRGGIVMTYNGNDDGACLVIEADCVRRGWKMDTYALGSSVYRWHTIYAVNSLNTSSDLRLKDILSDIPLTVEQVAAAPSFLYRWKKDKDGRAYAGSAAQYWQQVLPEAVLKSEDGYLSMEYDRLALAAVITTARTVVDHEQRIRRLEDALKVAV